MTHAPASWLPLAIAAVMAALTLWLNHISEQPLPQDDAAFRHDPDAVVENFVATAFDRNGYPRYSLAATRMTHFMDDDTTTLESPRFEQNTPGAPSVRAEARRGIVSSNGEHVHLLDEVRMTRAASQSSPELVLTTDYLHITPEAEVMQTERPVELRQGRAWMTAGSLLVDGKSRTLELRGRVKGSYEIHR